jgi:hypothetical protein
MSQQLKLKIRGLYTDPNNFSEVPEGALAKADNVVIDKDSVLESRRGQTFYGDELDAGEEIRRLFNYRDSLIASYDDKLAYDSDDEGTWVEYPGTYEDPDVGFKIRRIEANRNFYFNTSSGVQKLDSLTSTPRDAGAVKALGGVATLGSSGTGFLPTNSAVAYRLVWGYKDANNNLILGFPSQRAIVSNSSGSSQDVSTTWQIPAGIDSTWFYQLYRSPNSSSSSAEPNDEMQLVYEDSPTSGEISGGSVTIDDSTPDSLKGAYLYTAPSQEGIGNANEPPPYCKDMDVYKGFALYANTRSKQRLTLTLAAVGGDQGLDYVADTGDITNTSTTISDISDTSVLRVGMRVKGTGVPATAKIATIAGPNSITITVAATATTNDVPLEFQDVVTINGVEYYAASAQNSANREFEVVSAGTPAEDIQDTALGLVQAINQNASNTTLYAYYTSGYNDLPGRFLLEERDVGGNEFAATSNQGTAFNPTLPSSGTTIESSNDEAPNRVYISKYQQPEAVPLLSYLDLGSKDAPIRRIIALRDSAFVLKDDGIFRIIGEDTSSFRVVLFDNTAIVRAPDAAVPFNNQIMMFSEQGIISVSDSGVSVLSRPIESTLLQLSSDEYPAFENTTFAVSYESDRKYILYTVTNRDDEFPTQAFVFNSFTNTWTRWITSRTCGLVNSRDNKLYTGHSENGFVYQERKSFTLRDYADEQYPVTIVSSDALEVIVSDATGIEVGMSLGQSSSTAQILEIDGTTLTVDRIQTWSAGSADVYEPIVNDLRWLPIDIGNPGMLKHFREMTLFFRDAAFREIDTSFSSNFSAAEESVTLESIKQGAWGKFPWGSIVWGGTLGGIQALRTYVVLDKRRACWLNVGITNTQAFTSMSLSGVSIVYEVMDTRFF